MASMMTRRRFVEAVSAAGASIAAGTSLGRGPAAAQAPAGGPARAQAVIDSHVHLKHGDAAKTEYPARVIVEVMDKAGIDRSIVFAMSTTTRRSIEMAEQAVAQYPDRLIPYAYALPSYERPVLKELEAALAGRLFRGIKIHRGECTLAEYVIDPVLKLAGRFGVPCLIDATGNDAVARRLAETFPEIDPIFAHMGAYGTTNARVVDAFIELAEDHDRVRLDVSLEELSNADHRPVSADRPQPAGRRSLRAGRAEIRLACRGRRPGPGPARRPAASAPPGRGLGDRGIHPARHP